MWKGSIKNYLVFITVSGFILFLAYHHILKCYALSDDYVLLYSALYTSAKNFITHHHMVGGRPVYGVFQQWLFSNLTCISDLRYARIVSLIGIVLFSVLLYRAYLSSGWRKVEGGCAAIITCLMPAFGVYAAWATMFLGVYGASVGFISGKLCIKSYDLLCLEGCRLKAIILMLGSVFLLMISLMIYQSVTPAFWLFVAITLFKPQGNSEGLFRKSLYCFVIFSSTAMVYLILIKASIWPFTVHAYRIGMTIYPLRKIYWFLKYPLSDVFSIFSVLQEKVVISITIATVFAIMLVGLYLRIRRNNKQRWKFVVVFLALLPLCYLPNLASSIDSAAFRGQGILGSLVVFYIFLSLKEIFQSRVIRIIMPCLLAVFSIMAYRNVTYGLIEPQKQELELIRHALKEPLLQQPKEIIFIRSHWSDSLAAKFPYDEYGLPSSYWQRVPTFLINIIAREDYDDTYEWIKVRQYKYGESFALKEGIPVINAHKLLKEFKIKIKSFEYKFNASTDILLLINRDKGYDALKALHQLSFQYKPEGMVLRSYGHDPHFALPLFNFPSEKDLVVKIDITSPKDTVLQLYYATKSVPHYSEKQSVKKRINKGNNVVFIQLPPKDYTGHFRLDPGKIVGEFLLSSIEIRGMS